jgi:hypothetical protein
MSGAANQIASHPPGSALDLQTGRMNLARREMLHHIWIILGAVIGLWVTPALALVLYCGLERRMERRRPDRTAQQ